MITPSRRFGALSVVSIVAGALIASVASAPAASAASAVTGRRDSPAAVQPAAARVATTLTVEQHGPYTFLSTFAVTGVLSDKAGRSTAGQTVTISYIDMDTSGPVVRWEVIGHAVTDAHGRYTLKRPNIEWSNTYQAAFAGTSQLGASRSAQVALNIVREKITAVAHASYGHVTTFTGRVTSGGKAPAKNWMPQEICIDTLDQATKQWGLCGGAYGEVNADGTYVVETLPSTTTITYRARVYSEEDGYQSSTSPTVTVAAVLPATTVAAGIVRRNESGFVAGAFTIAGKITSQSSAAVSRPLTLQIYRQKLGTKTWTLIGHTLSNSKGAWSFTSPTDTTVALQARLQGSSTFTGSVSATIQVIKT